jgi:hypothetical protein
LKCILATMDGGLREFEEFFDQVEARLAADLPDLQKRADRLLALYRGIPARVNVFEVVNLIGNEDRHSDFLAWLLDPAAGHGMGDAFLRRFLALTGAPRARRAAHRPDILRAAVRTRFTLPGAGIPDLAIIVRGSPTLVVLCEAKIHAALTYSNDGVAQTTAYRQWVAEHGVDALLEQLGPLPFAPGPRPELVLNFLRAQDGQEPEPTEEARLWTVIEYASLERVLGRMVRDGDLPTEARDLIQQFRTSILEGGLPGREPIPALRRLRLLRDLDDGSGRSHITAMRLRRLLETLSAPGVTHG